MPEPMKPLHPIFFISLDKYYEKEDKLKAEHAKLNGKLENIDKFKIRMQSRESMKRRSISDMEE